MHQIHLIGAKTRAQFVAHTALAKAAAKEGKQAPKGKYDFAGFSGRGVRLRMLTPDEKDQASFDVAKLQGENATNISYHRGRARECAMRCIAEVTRAGNLDEAGLATTAWVKVTPLDLETQGELNAARLFTPKDIDILCAWFKQTHDLTDGDLEAIMGNVVELAGDG